MCRRQLLATKDVFAERDATVVLLVDGRDAVRNWRYTPVADGLVHVTP